MRNLSLPFRARFLPCFAPDGAGGAAAATLTETTPPGDAAATTPPAAATPAEPPAARWFENAELVNPDEVAWLRSKGLTLDDPAQAAAKLLKGHRSAEQYIGKGVDKIIERPADGQAYAEWARNNAAALGLPETVDGYTFAPPETWPKDAPWDKDFEAKFRAVAFEQGLPPAAAQKVVDLYAERMAGLLAEVDAKGKEADAKMMADLERDYGDQVPAVLARARQAAQAVMEKAGIDQQAIDLVSRRLSQDMGDAAVIRVMNAIGEMMGEDTALGLGASNGGLAATRADAEAALHEFMKPGGEWYQASLMNDRAAMDRLRPKFDQLTKAAARFSAK